MDADTHAQHPLDGPPSRSQRRLDITAPGDCLALVKHTFGRLPRESLVVIGLLDGYTGGHMRIDLQPALHEPFGSARLVADCLAGEGASPAPEAALVVLLGEGPASAAQDGAWRSCFEALRMILESEYCVRIVQAWFVCADHVRDPLCADAGCCVLPGRPIEDLSVPTLEGLSRSGSRPEAQPLDQAADRFLDSAPRADPDLDELLAESRQQTSDRRDPLTLRRRLEAWDVALCRREDSAEPISAGGPAVPGSSTSAGWPGEGRDDAERLTELLQQLRTGFDRDQLIPLATLGLDAALLGLRHDQGLLAGSADHMDHTGSPNPAEEHLLQDYASCFLGETAGRPDWDRVDALESVLSQLVPYARGAERENLLCLMAWIEWARGRGTAAGSFIDRCLQEFPANEFSRLIERLMQVRGVCRWARVKQRSWSWARSSIPGVD